MFSYDLTKTTFDRGLGMFFIGFTIICVPAWFLYQFMPIVFAKTDLIRLLVICMSIGFPLVLLNTSSCAIIHVYVGNRFLHSKEQIKMDNLFKRTEDKEGLAPIYAGCILSLVGIYIPCMMRFFLSISLRGAIWIASSIFIAFFLVGFVAMVVKMKQDLDEIE